MVAERSKPEIIFYENETLKKAVNLAESCHGKVCIFLMKILCTYESDKLQMSYKMRYAFLLSTQILLIVTDLLLNAVSEFTRPKPELQLVVFIFQDVLLVISLTVTLISFFSTYVFQAGLVDLLFERFRLAILISVFYLILTIFLHAWLLTMRWSHPLKFNWPTGLAVYFVLQRTFSPIYYYSTKRAILRISDPRFYQNLDWISQKILDKT